MIAAAAARIPCETLDIAVTGDEPPSEFRIFTSGKVVTSKGEYIFDAASAKSVMDAWRDQGNELMVDYDHASLAPFAMDPAQAGKAAGWFGLEVRNAELWAVNVRWTEPAAEALRRKEWRYMSPAFQTKGKKIVAVINVALTNIPATKRLVPLMAASATEAVSDGATVEEDRMPLSKILGALGLPADATEDDILKKLADKQPKAAPAAPAVVVDSAFESIAADAHREVQRQNEIDNLREAQRVAQVRELLRSTDRYATPAFESLALSKTPDEVRAMLGALPKKPTAVYAPGGTGAGARPTELTHAEIRMANLLGQDHEALRAHKAKLVERARRNERVYANALASEMGDF